MPTALGAEITPSLPKATPRPAIQQRARKIARDLSLLDEMEAFFAPLTKDTKPLSDNAVAQSYLPSETEVDPA